MITIFSIAIISFSFGYADDNEAVVDLEDDERVTLTNLESEVDTFRLQTNSSAEAFAVSGIDTGDETSRTGGVFKGITRL